MRYFKKKFGLNYMVTRISNPYGPGQNVLSGQGVISIFLDKLYNDEPITIFGDGSMVRDYIYIEDVARMLADTFQVNNTHEVYNFGAGVGFSVNDIVEKIESVTGKTFKKTQKEAPETYVHHIVLDTNRYNREFGAPHLTSIEKGLLKTWQNLQAKNS